MVGLSLSAGRRQGSGAAGLACAFACVGALSAYAQPARAAEDAPVATAPAEQRFVLMGLTIDGVTAYPMKELAPLYADQLTREVALADLVAIAQKITDKYRADGYFLARAVVPPQGPTPGLARIVVDEGYVGDIRVDGAAAPAVKRLLGGVTEHKPLKLSELDRRLTLATDLPGLKLKSQLEPVIDDPARHVLVVHADVRRLTGSIYLDNRGTETAGPWQAYGRLAVNSAMQAGDQLGVSLFTVPEDPKEFSQLELSYGMPLPTGGSLRTSASAGRARDPSANLSGVLGNENRAASLRVSHPLSRGRKHAVWAQLAFDANHVEQDLKTGAGYADDLRVVRAAVVAQRQGPGRSSEGFLQFSQGLDVLGATDRPTVRLSRWDADGQFWKVNAHASHYRDLGHIAGLFVAADGQFTDDTLLASEEFAVGANPYGRAYNYAEIAGESGVAGLVELRVGWDPKLAPLTFFQAYAFADAGQVWRRNAWPGWKDSALASAGAGVRLTVSRRATFRLEAARPLTRTPWAAGDKDWRLFASLNAGF